MIKMSNKENMCREELLKVLNIKTVDDLNIKRLELMYKDELKEKESSKAKKTKIGIGIEVDKESGKYKMLLKFVNKMLVNLNKEEIADLRDFKDIKRFDIISESNLKLLHEMSNDLFTVFDKRRTGYYRKTDTMTLNCFRGMCKQVGLKLKNEGRDVYTEDGFRKAFIFYWIE